MKVFVVVIFVSFLVINDAISPRPQKEVKKDKYYSVIKSDSSKVQKRSIPLEYKHKHLVLPIPASPPPFSIQLGKSVAEKPKLPRPPSLPPPSGNNS